MITNKQKRRMISGAAAVLATALCVAGCAKLKPDNIPTLPDETGESSAETQSGEETVSSGQETESQQETDAEQVEITISVDDTTSAEVHETYAIAEGYTRVNQIVEPTVNINLRTGPGTEYESLGLLLAPTQVERISDGGEWSQIVYEGQVCYVASSYLQVVQEVEEITNPAAETTSPAETLDASEEEPAASTDEETQSEETEAPTEPAAVTYESKTLDELAALSNESIPYGFGSGDRDAQNRPNGVLYYENLYGNYAADFIAPNTSNTIYLTMDEGYEAGYTPELLDTLKEKNVKAVFFVTKQFVTENPDLVKRMIAEGHQIGNHTCAHPSAGMPSLGLQAEYDDITWLHNYVLENFGYNMTLFRYPSGIFSEQSISLVNSLGYHAVFWSYAHRDWVVDDQPDEATALQNCLDSLHPGAIYLLHAVSATNTHNMAAFIDGARAAGYEFGVYPSNGF
jgi:peptidoglycan-N-acetylmuramic acid deacetylase